MAGRGHREKGACRPASGCDPDAGKCGKICTHDFESQCDTLFIFPDNTSSQTHLG